MDISSTLKTCTSNLVGLEEEIKLLLSAIKTNIPAVIEGESGVGKTELVKTVVKALKPKRLLFRADGDENLNIGTLRGWFDPPLVLEKGFTDEAFIAGPLTRALQNGGVFFFNEVNRAPSEAINGVLTAMDEREIYIPKLGKKSAHDNFYTVFTQNPTEYIGTNPLPEAFFDRCVYIKLEHKSGKDAHDIVTLRTECQNRELIELAVRLVDESRSWHQFELGASIRGAIQIVLLLDKTNFDKRVFTKTAIAVLSKKVKLFPDISSSIENCITQLVEYVYKVDVKKKD